jgi:hypothetical protein
VSFLASTAQTAGLNIPPGVTPISPSNGDIFMGPSGLFYQINGATVGPLGAGGGTGGGGAVSAGTAGQLAQYASTGTTVSGLTLGANVPAALAAPTNTAGGLLQINNSGDIPATPQLGVVNGSNACAGCVGEDIASDVPLASAITVSSGATANVASVTLTPGDFDCRGTVVESPSAQATGVGFTNGIGTTSATLPAALENATSGSADFATGPSQAQILPIAAVRENVTASTTVFLTTNITFTPTSATMKAYGRLECRRMR